jgi:hypothetical protein
MANIYTIQSGVDISFTRGSNIAKDSSGNLHCLYSKKEGENSYVYYAKSTNGGASWTHTKISNNSSKYQMGNMQIVIDSNDVIHTAWKEAKSANQHYIKYRKYTTSWQSEVTIYNEWNGGILGALFVDSNNDVYVYYIKNDHSPWDVCYKKYTTSWGDETIAFTGRSSNDPVANIYSLVEDSNHNLYAFYSTYYYSWYLRYVKYDSSTGTWGSITDIYNHGSRGSISYVNATVDSNNHIHLIIGGTTGYGTQNWYLKSEDGASTWSNKQEVFSGVSGNGECSIMADANDNIDVISSIILEGDTYAQIKHRQYTTSWSEIESLTSVSVDQRYPFFLKNKINGYIFTWYDGTEFKIYNAEIPVVAPTVTTQSATNVDTTSFTGNGNITDTGGENCTRRGFCYKAGTSGDPTTSDSVAYDDGSFGTGAFTKSLSGLTPNTSYRVRAYAINSAGTSYGTTVDVTTLKAFKPRTTWF